MQIKVKQAKQKRMSSMTPKSATPKSALRRSTATRIVVTDDNVEKLKERFDSLSKNDPEYDRLGDALHRYMIG
jgi:hypothetical protein